MKRRKVKLIALFVAATIPMVLFAACKKTTEDTKAINAVEPNKVDTSKKVNLTWYVFGSAHADSPKVMEELNKMSEKDINAKLDIKFIDWTDWATKYNLLLSTGEKFDAVFVAQWSGFFKYAKQGAFKDLTNLIPTYAPETWKNTPKESWNDVTLGGKIYGLPNIDKEYTPNGLVFREDLRKKYNLPEIKDLTTLETYLEEIKKNMPNITPIANKPYDELTTLFEAVAGYEIPGGNADTLIRVKNYKTPNDIIAYPFTDEFANWAKRMKTWADKGYISKNAIAATTNAVDGVKAGTGVIQWNNPAAAGGNITGYKTSNPDWEFGYFPFTRMTGYSYLSSSIQNGMAIPISAENTERSLMMLDKVKNDVNYFRLLEYGIKGNHYDISEDGKHIIVPAKGQDPKTNTGFSIASWGWRNQPLMLNRADGWPGMEPLIKEFDNMKVQNIYTPVYLDLDSCQAELAAVNQVKKQYGDPLMMGVFENVDAKVKEYRDKLKAAGIDKVQEVVKKSMTEYYKDKGIK